MLLAGALLLSGCASLLNKDKQSLLINSSPTGATVYENGAEVGATPFTYTYDRHDAAKVTVELRQEGRQPVNFELAPKKNNAILLADALLLGIPYIVDGKSNQLYSFPQKELQVNLYKAIPSEMQRVDLPVTMLEHTLGAKATMGKVDAHVLKLDSKELGDLRYPETGTAALIRGMNETFVDAGRVKLHTPKGDEAIERAKIYLRPVLTQMDMQLEKSDDRAYGTVHLEMEWRFFSGLEKDSLLFTIVKGTDYPVFALPMRDVFVSALQDASRQLIDEDGLYERLTDQHKAGLLRSKGASLSLARPVPIPFAARKDMLSALVTGVVTVETKDGHGSGFLITNDGYIMTNAHVVDHDATVKVRFQQGFTLDGQVVKVNRDYDVALIKVAGNDLAALTMGDDAGLQLGEELFAIGTPLDEKLGQSVTRGIMSGRRTIEDRSYLQTDVSINPGNSGGPLINEEGKVVGVATLKISGEGVEGIGFGVPISTALDMLNIAFTK